MTGTSNTITATPEEFAAAFTEWERQYREDPEAFMSDAEVLSNDVGTSGEQKAAFFIELLEKLPIPSV